MKKATSKTKKILLITLIVILLCVLVGGIIAITRAAKGQKGITLNGEEIKNGTAISLLEKSDLRFELYASDYTLKIVPNPEAEDFDYVLNDRYVSFEETSDYTAFFDIEKEKKAFTLSVSKQFDIYLSEINDGADISIPDDLNVQEIPYFMLVVEMSDGSYNFPLYADLYGYILSVTLDFDYIEL